MVDIKVDIPGNSLDKYIKAEIERALGQVDIRNTVRKAVTKAIKDTAKKEIEDNYADEIKKIIADNKKCIKPAFLLWLKEKS